jgi:hypothetical protein
MDEWLLVASDSVSSFIPEGTQLVVSFDPQTETLQIDNPLSALSPTQMEAIARAPAWLRDDLYDSFRRFLYPFLADSVALRIINARDPYVDEMAFQGAHIGPGLLMGLMPLNIMLENAQGVYSADRVLEYVQLVDYGNSGDDDYWTTARYRVVETNGDTLEMEIERDIYYWYILHPKLSDENPLYINPQTGQSASPPAGVFWRDYLWNHADSGYALLRDHFLGCDFLWAHLTNTSGVNNGAIGLVNTWINDVMNWGAGLERPIQPVRIYALHCGNCGEYSDITAAAGRIALIPTVCASNYCEDHTWNEFWDEEWIAWEPVNNYVNSPLVYENGWGKVISAVFDWRGDGWLWTCTDRYSEGICSLFVNVSDAQGKPADGVKITLQNEAIWGGMYTCAYAITNANGIASFVLGDAQNFYARATGILGTYPLIGYAQVISNSLAGTNYTWNVTLGEYTLPVNVSQAPDYPNPQNTYLMEIVYECNYETTYGIFTGSSQFAYKNAPGVVDFFIVNDYNYLIFSLYAPAQGFAIGANSPGGEINFVLPTDEPWQAVFSTREMTTDRPYVTAHFNIYRNSETGVSRLSDSEIPTNYALDSIYPNPFNSEAYVSFSVPSEDRVRIIVYDITGRKVAIVTDDYYAPGQYRVKWDSGQSSSGIYLATMEGSGFKECKKVALLK